MFHSMTVVQALMWFFGIFLSGGAIAVFLARWVPKWDAVPGWAKNVVIVLLTQGASMLLTALIGYIPTAIQGMTIEQVVTGLFMAAAAYVLHLLDEIAKNKSLKA